MTPVQLVNEVVERWRAIVVLAAIFSAGMMLSSYINLGRQLPARVAVLERADSAAQASGSLYSRRLAEQVDINRRLIQERVDDHTRRLDMIEPAVKYIVCLDREKRRGRDGGACEYFIEGREDLFRPGSPR